MQGRKGIMNEAGPPRTHERAERSWPDTEEQLFREQGKGKEKRGKEQRNSELWRRELT